MDASEFVAWAGGSSALAATFGLLLRQTAGALESLARARAAKVNAEAATEQAAAAAVAELAKTVSDLRGDLSAVQLENESLRKSVDTLRADHEKEKSTRMHYESQYNIVVQEIALERKNNAALKLEMDELRDAINSGHTRVTLPPPPDANEHKSAGQKPPPDPMLPSFRRSKR